MLSLEMINMSARYVNDLIGDKIERRIEEVRSSTICKNGLITHLNESTPGTRIE